MEMKYLRIQTKYCGKTGKPVGIFGACYHLSKGTMRDDKLTREEDHLFRQIEDWFKKELPNPAFYDDGNSIKGITWFKAETTSHMVKKIEPLIALLVKYNVPYDIMESHDVGTIIYEDEFQVGVI